MSDPTVDWIRPGPGTWVLDLDHTGPMPSRPARDLLSRCGSEGFAEGFALLGAPLATIDMAFVNGRFYTRAVPVMGADRDLRPPPAPVLWAAARLSPTFRRLERTAAAALRERIWRTELERWNSTWRPELVAANTRLGAVDPEMLDDAGLARHLTELGDHLRWSTTLHFRLHTSDMGPIGLLLVATDRWGLARGDVLGALAGASPATNEPATVLGQVRRVVDEARRSAGPDRPLHTLDDVRDLGPDVAEAVDRYVATFGWRLTTGYDVTDRTLVELPELLVRSLTAPVDATIPSGHTQRSVQARGSASITELRQQVPEHDRDTFDVLVSDARDCYGLRDENGPLTYEWPAGILRRALLDAGARLERRGDLRDAEHVFDATVDETASLLSGAAEPDGDELAARHAERVRWPMLEPPTRLGPPETRPPLWTLPRNMRALMSATMTLLDLLDTAAHPSTGGDPGRAITGTGVGDTTYRGTARVVHDAPDALANVEPGDVLVTTRTVPTFNAVLTIAGAVVVEEGGLMSHAAVMARELGIAGVIGATGALTGIPDGATVEVDPVAGQVTVID